MIIILFVIRTDTKQSKRGKLTVLKNTRLLSELLRIFPKLPAAPTGAYSCNKVIHLDLQTLKYPADGAVIFL